MDIRKRILKGETKRLAGRVLSEENADKVADFIFEDENTENNKQEININESNNTDDNESNNTDDNESNLTAKIDSWLAEKEKKIEQEETPDPVTDLEDMEDRIDDLNSELDET